MTRQQGSDTRATAEGVVPTMSAKLKPGYKQTEVGVIPEDWLNPQLQQITDDDSPICYGIVQVGPFTPNGIEDDMLQALGQERINKTKKTSTH